MLASTRDDLMYLLNIIESIGKIELYASGAKDALAFYELNEQLNFNAALNLLANIGENARKISMERKTREKELPWEQLRGFRNRIVHDYVNVDVAIVYSIIQHELPKLRQAFIASVSNGLINAEFDVGEWEAVRHSQYYRHIDFQAFTYPN